MRTLIRFCVVCMLTIAMSAMAATAKKQTLPRVAKPFMAPNFTLTGDDGKHYTLTDYRGKVVVINFWASWCPPCRHEMPSMQRMWKKLKDKGVQVLAVDVGEDADTVFQFLGSYPVSFPLLLDRHGKVIKLFPVTGLPTTYIIDPSGRVVRRAVGSREWDDPALYQQLLKLRSR